MFTFLEGNWRSMLVFPYSATRSCVQCLLLRLLSFFSTFLLMYTHYYISVRTLTSKHTQTHMHDIIQYKSVAHSCTIICCDRFRPCCHFFILFFGAFCVFIWFGWWFTAYEQHRFIYDLCLWVPWILDVCLRTYGCFPPFSSCSFACLPFFPYFLDKKHVIFY